MAGLGVPEPDATFCQARPTPILTPTPTPTPTPTLTLTLTPTPTFCQGSRRLDPVDEAQQALFLRDLWKFLRAGRLDDAKVTKEVLSKW